MAWHRRRHRLVEREPLNAAASVALGIGAAICWGLADFFAAVYTRKIGAMRVVVITTVGTLVAYLGPYLILRPDLHVRARDLLAFGGISLGVVVTYLAFYQALSAGPISIVAPVASAYAAVVVILSLIFLHERLTFAQSIASVVTLGGVVLTSTDFGRRPEGVRMGRGALFALVAMVGFGVTSFANGYYTRRYGFLVGPVLTRLMVTACFLMLAATRNQWPWQRARPRTMLFILAIGLIDGVGFLLFTKGAEIGVLSLVATASASYTLIPLVLGILVFKEKMVFNQRVGTAAVLIGVAFLGLSS